jgi:hypothetical protein
MRLMLVVMLLALLCACSAEISGGSRGTSKGGDGEDATAIGGDGQDAVSIGADGEDGGVRIDIQINGQHYSP